MNMVGTPWTAVQRSVDMARRVWRGSKCWAGMIMVEPVDDAVEAAHDASEAVIEGNLDAQAVVLVHFHGVADV